MKTLFMIIMVFVAENLQADTLTNFAVDDNDFKLVYQPDTLPAVPCQHKRVRDLPDWTVFCEDRYHKKEFSVHLVVRKYRRREPAGNKYEVLYWVTNRLNPRKREYAGTSMNFIFNGEVKAEKLQLGQMVDKGIANLELHLKLKN